jgi:hypothetical protein
MVDSLEKLYTEGSDGKKYALMEIRGDWKYVKAQGFKLPMLYQI